MPHNSHVPGGPCLYHGSVLSCSFAPFHLLLHLVPSYLSCVCAVVLTLRDVTGCAAAVLYGWQGVISCTSAWRPLRLLSYGCFPKHGCRHVNAQQEWLCHTTSLFNCVYWGRWQLSGLLLAVVHRRTHPVTSRAVSHGICSMTS